MTEEKKEQLYYIVDKRSIVGNCATFWAKGGHGYCCNIEDAGLFPVNHSDRESDLQLPQELVESCIVKHVRFDSLRAECSKRGVSFSGGRLKK